MNFTDPQETQRGRDVLTPLPAFNLEAIYQRRFSLGVDINSSVLLRVNIYQNPRV